MATKSFLKNVEIKDRKLAEKMVDALDAYTNKPYEPATEKTTLSRKCTELTGENIKAFFGIK